MVETRREATRDSCAKQGIHWVRSVVTDRSDGMEAQHMREWIDEYETTERNTLEQKQLQLARESIDAAKTSAQAALDSAQYARDSAKATKWAVAVAIVAALAAIAQAVSPLVTAK